MTSDVKVIIAKVVKAVWTRDFKLNLYKHDNPTMKYFEAFQALFNALNLR